MDEELDRFKRHINLIEYAASQGYKLDKQRSYSREKALRGPSGDKVYVTRAADGHWQYHSFSDPSDSGTILDFVQRRQGVRLGGARQHLRQWSDSPAPSTLPAVDTQVKQIHHDRELVARQYAEARTVGTQRYLEQERGIARQTHQDARFRGTWKQAGPYRNVVFPHWDGRGLTGLERKNKDFGGIAPGGRKGVWCSRARKADTRLIITESPIDAMSYHQLRPSGSARYVAFSGRMSSAQPELLSRAMAKMQSGSTVVAATDRDAAGDAFAAQIKGIAQKHAGLSFERAIPKGKDWNDDLRSLSRGKLLTRGLER